MTRRVLVLALALAFALPAAGGAASYVGFYVDDTHQHWCTEGSPPYTVTLWACAFGGPEGMIAASFNFGIPGNAALTDLQRNDPILVWTIGGPDYALQLAECLYGWAWLLRGTLIVLDGDPTEVTMTGPIFWLYPGPPVEWEREYVSCEEGYPRHGLDPVTILFLNRSPHDPVCGTTGAEAASWGAIKGCLR
ncbi:MAG: hypothetical protein JW876_00035 [Candidatus Krumholzibacteriota bacterium]|nr:hypothetical protein [Candidatus Krumholzibacteriota bacterium]